MRYIALLLLLLLVGCQKRERDIQEAVREIEEAQYKIEVHGEALRRIAEKERLRKLKENKSTSAYSNVADRTQLDVKSNSLGLKKWVRLGDNLEKPSP